MLQTAVSSYKKNIYSEINYYLSSIDILKENEHWAVNYWINSANQCLDRISLFQSWNVKCFSIIIEKKIYD